jgi:DUF1680 family protein
MLWYHRMFLREGDAKYYDTFERTLYNGYLSGVSLAGDSFFYQNPLISNGTIERSAYFDVACCPANLARLMAQLPGLIYAQRERVNLDQHTTYPWDGRIAFDVNPEQPMDLTLAIRIPGRVDEDRDKAAIQRGPIVYCVEAVDNAGRVANLRLPLDARLRHTFDATLLGGVEVIRNDTLVAVPYYAWANRRKGEMAVWIPYR